MTTDVVVIATHQLFKGTMSVPLGVFISRKLTESVLLCVQFVVRCVGTNYFK